MHELWLPRRMNRRNFLRATGLSAAGLWATTLIGCDDDDDGATAQEPASTTTGTGGSTPEKRGGRVKTAYAGNFSQLDPTTGSGGTDHQALWPVFDNLVAYDHDFNLDPDRSLAESWEIVDETTIALTLRPNVVFHDGEPFNSAAVAKHIEYGQQNETSTVKSDLGAIKLVEATDPQHVVLHLTRPFSPLLRVLGDRAGMMISPRAIEQWGANLNRTPIGAGAFKFTEEVLDSHYRVQAFEQYWDKNCPAVESIEWKLGVNPQQQANALLAKDINLLFDPDPENLSQLEGAGMAVRRKPTPWVGLLFFNPTLEPWNNPHARRAVQYGIDREALVETVWSGIHEPAHFGWLGPASGAYHDPKFVGYRYDPAKVREELNLAGMPDGFDAICNIANSPSAIAEAEFIQAGLREFGINLKLQSKPAPDYFREYYDVKVPSFIASMSARADMWQQINYVHGAGGPFDVGAIPTGGDPEMEKIFREIEAIYDEEERVPAMRRLNEKAHELAWFVLLYYRSTVAVSPKELDFQLFSDGKPHLGRCDIAFKG